MPLTSGQRFWLGVLFATMAMFFLDHDTGSAGPFMAALLFASPIVMLYDEVGTRAKWSAAAAVYAVAFMRISVAVHDPHWLFAGILPAFASASLLAFIVRDWFLEILEKCFGPKDETFPSP